MVLVEAVGWLKRNIYRRRRGACFLEDNIYGGAYKYIVQPAIIMRRSDNKTNYLFVDVPSLRGRIIKSLDYPVSGMLFLTGIHKLKETVNVSE